MDKIFRIRERGSTPTREVVGGVTTFLAMSYILAVNPDILSKSGMDWNSVFTATAASAAIGTLVMAFCANLPVALAPGLGLNAFFTYSVVMSMGCSWQFALTAVLLEGVLFIALSAFGVREAIMNSIPADLRRAVSVGIGLFIALIGLVNGGICEAGGATPVAFANFDGAHVGAIVCALGLVVTIALYVLKGPGAGLLGITATTLIGIPFGVTKVPDGWAPLATPAVPHLLQFDFAGVLSLKFFIVFFTFLFTDLFDTIGTLLGVSEQAGLTGKDGRIPNAKGALFADAAGTVVGACLGTSTVTSFVESASGVAAGARTGLASVVTAGLFVVALFLNPLFALIPQQATAPALIFVGFLMMKSVTGINFGDLTEGIPAFVTIIVMPFGYSVAKGIVWGVICYVVCKCVARRFREVHPVTWALAVVFAADIVFEAVKSGAV